jgi:NADH:ubiquinone oxidoreductase subunit 6 (subunit J)
MTFSDVLFWLIALAAGVSAVGVAVTQNIVRAAVWLLFALASTAGIFFLLGADFVGATQLLVYVGGILILVIFGVMLTAQGPFVNLKTSAGEWAVSLVVGLLLFGLIGASLLVTPWEFKQTAVPDPEHSRSSDNLGLVLLGFADVNAKAPLSVQPSNEPDAARVMRTRMSYLLPFEIVSVHLLVVLLGAAYLARAKRRRGAQS